jgi:hypothetical protein
VKGTRPLVRYRADGAWSCGCEPLCKEPGGPWKPSIFMPPWASRITLEIVNVRVERVQEISEVDAKAEGVFQFSSLGIYGYDKNGTPGKHCRDSAVETYKRLWDSINAESGFGWDVNPWVWVVEFKRVNQ